MKSSRLSALLVIAVLLVPTLMAQEQLGPSAGASAAGGSDPSTGDDSQADGPSGGAPLGGGNSRITTSGGQGTVIMGDGEETIPNTKTPARLKDSILIDTIPLLDLTGPDTGDPDSNGNGDGGYEARITVVGRPGEVYAFFLGPNPKHPSVMLSVNTMPGSCSLSLVVPLPVELALLSPAELASWTVFVYQVGDIEALAGAMAQQSNAASSSSAALSARGAAIGS